MAEDFEEGVEDGLRLSKRICFGSEKSTAPPKPLTAMERENGLSYLPTAPMLYAVVIDPSIVDNPDIPSYQPYVHGRCDPPALIPLQMNQVSLEAECYLDTALVTMNATWRVHCVMGNRSCDCKIAVPMGEQGSILGVEVELPRKSYSTQLIGADGDRGLDKVANIEEGGFLKPHIFTLTIPQVDGGTNISVTLRWSQKIQYKDGQFILTIPLNFPEYVTPAIKKISKHEKILVNVHSGPGTELTCITTSLLMREMERKEGKLCCLRDEDVISWSNIDFEFIYSVNPKNIFGGVLLSSPSLLDVDRREMFCCYLFPKKQQIGKLFRREVVFVVDISGSMKGKLLDDTKNALFAALAKLGPQAVFNVIAFNDETYLFSSSMEPATEEAIKKVTEWITVNFVAGGGTNILNPLNQAIAMLDSCKSIPIIFLITDGAVQDERHICDVMKSQLTNQKNVCPRIYTVGIGTFCNHYFLKMLAIIGRGHHEAASNLDTIEDRIEGLFSRASSIVLSNISFDNLDNVDDLEVFPSRFPDLSFESPLIVSGRYSGTFPETLKLKGILSDKSNYSLDLKVEEAKEIPIGKIVAKEQIELLTAQAWFSENKELEEKVAKMSVLNAIISEYTNMVWLETQKAKPVVESVNKQKPKRDPRKKVDQPKKVETEEPKPQTRFVLTNLGLGFGDMVATAENIPPPRPGEGRLPEAAEIFAKATSNCCGKLFGRCCCGCCIHACSRMNDQCALVFAQLFGAFACLGCFACCNACCGGRD